MIDFKGLCFDKRSAVYEQIALHVKRQIFLGTAHSGDVMPSRRELAAITGVNPNTAQKAYHLMEDEGIIATSGNTVSTVVASDEIKQKIEDELTRGLVSEFVQNAKSNHLSYKKVIALVSEVWGEE
ncbi:MAG: GntR family transcriptional regulator [Oscillospiraceae bacterium]